jgi:hypothetical protein
MDALPDAMSMFKPMVPLSVIDLPVCPRINTVSMGLSTFESTKVGISVWIPFETFSVPDVFLPVALVLAPVLVLHDPKSVPKPLDHHPYVHRIFKVLFDVTGELLELLKQQNVGLQLYIFDFETDLLWCGLFHNAQSPPALKRGIHLSGRVRVGIQLEPDAFAGACGEHPGRFLVDISQKPRPINQGLLIVVALADIIHGIADVHETLLIRDELVS